MLSQVWFRYALPDSKVHGANMGPTWVLSAPDGPPCWPHEPCYQGSPVEALFTWYDAPVAGPWTLRPVDEYGEVSCVDSRDIRSITKHHVKGLLDPILHDWLRFPPEDLLPDFSKYTFRGLLQNVMSCKDFSERSCYLVHGKMIISKRIQWDVIIHSYPKRLFGRSIPHMEMALKFTT